MDNGFYEDNNMEEVKASSAIAFIIPIVVILITFGVLIFTVGNSIKNLFKPNEEFISAIESSDGKYRIEAYKSSGGATTDFSVNCYLMVNRKKKNESIYCEYHINNVSMTWIDEDTVDINGEIIDLLTN